jgi:signal transduction histidine kinase
MPLTLERLYETMAAAATGTPAARVALPDDPDIDLVPVKLAIGLNTLLEDLEYASATRAAAESELRVALRAKDDFLGIVGHELRTPLSALLMQIQIMQRTILSDPPERSRMRLEKLAASAWRLERLIQQLLDVSRIGSTKLDLEPEPFDLVSLVHEAAARFVDSADACPSITIRTERPSVDGHWDRLRVDQVITNLISNALKYGRSQPVDVHLLVEDSHAVVHVTDHGIGMDDAHLANLFNRFSRSKDVRQIQGFGLGLWIVRQIVEACAGTIEVQTKLAEGSTFTVRLPLVRAVE